MKKSIAGVAVTASVLTGGVAGLALTSPSLAGAQEDDPAAAEQAPDEVVGVFDQLVEEGVLTQEQADTVKERLRDANARFGPRMHGPRAAHQEILTEVLGVSEDELLQAREDGRSLADVADANGVDPQAVVDALVADLEEHLDQGLESGRLTDEQADERLAEATERIEDMVNGELEPGDRPGPRGPGGPGEPEAPSEES